MLSDLPQANLLVADEHLRVYRFANGLGVAVTDRRPAGDRPLPGGGYQATALVFDRRGYGPSVAHGGVQRFDSIAEVIGFMEEIDERTERHHAGNSGGHGQGTGVSD